VVPETVLNGITYANGLFVAVGGSSAGGSGFVETSTDGLNWIVQQSPAEDALDGIAYGNGQFIAVTSSSVLSSADGVNWVVRAQLAGSNSWPSRVAYGNGQFVATGVNCNQDPCQAAVFRSNDGSNWDQGHLHGTFWNRMVWFDDPDKDLLWTPSNRLGRHQDNSVLGVKKHSDVQKGLAAERWRTES
jgi:hypothetical protein